MKVLSLELAKDPALALGPVTEAVVRALAPRGRPCDPLYLTGLFEYLKKHNAESTWGEASVAGILCQLGMTFSVPARREGCEVEDFRCFFQICREVWPPTCVGAEVFVDCCVDISGCSVVELQKSRQPKHECFLGGFKLKFSKYQFPMPKDGGLECVTASTSSTLTSTLYRICAPCHLIGFDDSQSELVVKW